MKYPFVLVACTLSATLQVGTAAAGASAVQMPRGYAASSFESPVALGASWGAVGLGGVYYESSNQQDASIAGAIGLGDPDNWVGLETAAVVSSLSKSEGSESGLGDDGSFALKMHRNLGHYTAIAIGGSALGRWGSEGYKHNNPPGYYLALTRGVFLGDYLLMLSGGAGHRVTNNIETSGVDPFGSLALYLTHWFSVIVEHDGFSTNAALSVAPLSKWLPLTITAGAVDVTTKHNDNPNFNVVVGLGFNF